MLGMYLKLLKHQNDLKVSNLYQYIQRDYIAYVGRCQAIDTSTLAVMCIDQYTILCGPLCYIMLLSIRRYGNSVELLNITLRDI